MVITLERTDPARAAAGGSTDRFWGSRLYPLHTRKATRPTPAEAHPAPLPFGT